MEDTDLDIPVIVRHLRAIGPAIPAIVRRLRAIALRLTEIVLDIRATVGPRPPLFRLPGLEIRIVRVRIHRGTGRGAEILRLFLRRARAAELLRPNP